MSENTEITFSRWVDRVADEFEAAWKKGNPPSIQKYLEGYPPNQQHELLRELILIDFDYRHRAGETIDLGDYLRRFPELSKPDGVVDSELIIQARQVTHKRKSGEPHSAMTFDSRFDEDSTPFSIPKVIDKYQILDLVGEGAFGVVYKAIDTELNRTVAIKVPRSGEFLRPKDKERFQREAQSAATLNHSGIVKVLDVVLDGSLPYIVSDFIQGTTLAEFMNSRAISSRESAKLLLKITEAIEHAHQQGLVHRDLKPTNILIDEEENPHITDFGLAKSQSVDFTVTIEGQILGTPAYMSPEQARGESSSVDFRMDVYSLGAIFYELLTGEKPFRGTTQMVLQQVQHEQPRPPRKINERIPKDLETICLKCLEKEARLRFSSTTEMVEELNRFLRGDSILSRPVGRIETLWRWCKRNPIISGLVLLVALSLVTGTAISSYFAFDARSQKKIADEERESAQEERNEAEKQKILEQLRNLRLNERNYSGWTTKAKTLLEQARGKLSPSELRDQTVATYIGIEATLQKSFGTKSGSSVVFDESGKRLLIGGLARTPNERERYQDESGASVWDIENDALIETPERTGTGPVAFAKGQPVELIHKNKTTLILRTVPEHKTIQAFSISVEKMSNDEHFQWTLSKDATTVAASVLNNNGSRTAWVWNVESGKLLHELKTEANPKTGIIPDVEKPDARIALSSDGSLVAVGTENGEIYIWRVEDGTKLAVLPSSHNTIQALAFSPKPGQRRSAETQKTEPRNWMLAAGDSGGTIVIWNLAEKVPLSICLGSLHSVYALKFSPDGTILASGGRTETSLWNTTTGRRLLRISTLDKKYSTDYVMDLDFSPDGKSLVMAGKHGHAYGDEVHVWKLQHDWGVKTFRGLTGAVVQVKFSNDGNRLAVLGQDWKVCVWNTQTGRLENLFEVTPGEFSDNAGMVFSPDGLSLAFCSGTEAKMWNLKNGKAIGQWSGLPPGFQDNLCFDEEGRLLSVRFETKNKIVEPFENDRKNDPIVCRVRHLAEDSSTRDISESRHHFYSIDKIDFSSGGQYYAVHGSLSNAPRSKSSMVFDSHSGRLLWKTSGSGFLLDSTEQYVYTHYTLSEINYEVKRYFRTGEAIQERIGQCIAHGPDAVLRRKETPEDRNSLFQYSRHSEKSASLTFGIDQSEPGNGTFSPDGHKIAWGDATATIYLCDRNRIESLLSEQVDSD